MNFPSDELERFGISRKLGIDWKNTNDVTTRLGYACKYFPFDVSVEKKKRKANLPSLSLSSNRKRKETPFVPSKWHILSSRRSFQLSRRFIRVLAAHHRGVNGASSAPWRAAGGEKSVVGSPKTLRGASIAILEAGELPSNRR